MPSDRRPLQTRSRPSAQRVAVWLATRAATPNAISIAGLLLAAGAGACLALAGHGGSALLFAAAAILIQLRLASNLLDGLVAVEGGRATRTGPLYNEVPDRLADLFILVPAGYAISWTELGPELGWAAGVLAVLTAYVRLLGGSLGQPQRFSGPLAKPHRMFVLTIACLLSVAEAGSGAFQGYVLTAGLAVIALGSAATCVLRLRAIAAALPG